MPARSPAPHATPHTTLPACIINASSPNKHRTREIRAHAIRLGPARGQQRHGPPRAIQARPPRPRRQPQQLRCSSPLVKPPPPSCAPLQSPVLLALGHRHGIHPREAGPAEGVPRACHPQALLVPQSSSLPRSSSQSSSLSGAACRDRAANRAANRAACRIRAACRNRAANLEQPAA